MFDRSLVWLSAGVVAAGVSMAMVGGAGIAAADDGATAKGDAGTSSESSNSTGKKPDSEKQGSKPVTKKADDTDKRSGASDPDGKATEGASGKPAKDRGMTGKDPSEAAPTDEQKPSVRPTVGEDAVEEDAVEKGSDHDAAGSLKHQLSLFESLVSFFYGLTGNLRFGFCAADVDALLAEELAKSTNTFAVGTTHGVCHRGSEQT